MFCLLFVWLALLFSLPMGRCPGWPSASTTAMAEQQMTTSKQRMHRHAYLAHY